MSDLHAQPWRRFGHHRLYVNTADGERVGWVDLSTGSATLESPAHRADFEAAVAQWFDTHPDVVGDLTSRQSVAGTALPPLVPAQARQADDPREEPPPTWVDLAANRPGAAARAQAVAAREAAPVRTLLARVMRVHTDERAWRIGARGEERVAAQLAKLGAGWYALHAVEVGDRGSDIDHVLIGPAGVFTLNSKHHPGARVWVRGDKVFVNGRRVSYIRNSRHEADRAARLLTAACRFPVAVTGVIVPVGIADLDMSEEPTDVLVITRGQLVRALRRRPAVLDAETVERVHEAARRSDTWRDASALPPSTESGGGRHRR